MTLLQVTLHVNNEERVTTIRSADTLLYVLRNNLGLTGAKPGCLNGDCGACTILIEDIPIKSCLLLAIEAIGKKITTIEGLNDQRMQNAFIKNFAFQCGYCTPGFILNCYSLLQHNPNPTNEIISDWINSNICRCTGYEEIETTIKQMIKERSD